MSLARLACAAAVGVALVLASGGVAAAALLDDAKSLLSRLNDVGNLQGAADAAVRGAREAAERDAHDKYDAAVRQLAELRPRLEELERRYAAASKGGLAEKHEQRNVDTASRDRQIAIKQVDLDQARTQVGQLERKAASAGKLTPQERTQLDAARTKVAGLQSELAAQRERDTKLATKAKEAKLEQDNAKIDAMMKESREKYDQAMAAATTQLWTGIAAGLSSAASASAGLAAGGVQQKVNDARNGLRGLIPQPVGTRPPTRPERRCVGVGAARQCTDVQVPNNPSDGDLRGAIDAANAALRDAGRVGDIAVQHFQSSQQMQLDLQNATQRLNQFLALVSSVMKKYDETAKAVVNNLRG
jgi:hypothetical protein